MTWYKNRERKKKLMKKHLFGAVMGESWVDTGRLGAAHTSRNGKSYAGYVVPSADVALSQHEALGGVRAQ